ncbi:MAG: P pilus assembly/Cpx signaling pathway, periplasmic inhibitor/zinc-resistance associated protein [Nostoc sp.]|uniref:P pilus assembly/Cpx signaling pathway, periplasmic inhibitor/zinc-resistance associated protein n=1 Tax=Nostoc sp. TaxID=1180 RepID=UPI002FFB74F6
MKLKVLSLVAGAIALTLTATSFAVHAQTASPSPVLLAETPHGRWKDLNLSSLQESQIKDIHQQTWQQIENTVFTPDQKAQFEAAKQARKAAWQERKAQGQTSQQTGQHHHRHGGGIFAKLNLSQAQKDQIKALKKSERQKIKAVLTPAQQQQIQQFRQNRQQRIPG